MNARPPPQPDRQQQHPRHPRRQRRLPRRLDAARAGSRAAAAGIRRHRVARAAHAARGDPVGRRQSRRRRGRRRGAGPRSTAQLVRREGRAADRARRADPRVRRAAVGPADDDAARRWRSPRCCARSCRGAEPQIARQAGVGDRARHRRRPAAGRGRRSGAAPRLPEPGRQRDEVRRRAAAGSASRASRRRRRRRGQRRAIAASASPPRDQAKIFDPFYRAPDVVAAQIQGAGLGLSLVKRIVEAHGGRITAEERARAPAARSPSSLPILDAATPRTTSETGDRPGVARTAASELQSAGEAADREAHPAGRGRARVVLTLTDRLTREGYSRRERRRRRERARARDARARSICCCST